MVKIWYLNKAVKEKEECVVKGRVIKDEQQYVIIKDVILKEDNMNKNKLYYE